MVCKCSLVHPNPFNGHCNNFSFGKGYWQVFVAVGITMWVEVVRLVRGEFISQRNREYVEAGSSFRLFSF